MKPRRRAPLLIGLLLVAAMGGVAAIGSTVLPPSGNPATAGQASTPSPEAQQAGPSEEAQTRVPSGGLVAAAAPASAAAGTPRAVATEQRGQPSPALEPSPLPSAELGEATATLSTEAGGGASQPIVFGHSALGEPLIAYRLGSGPIKVVLVGDIHGSYEANTQALVEQLRGHYESHVDEIPASVSLWLVPVLNPDGLASGTRWNANNVDLNRNADTDLDGCAGNDWSADTVGSEGSYAGAGGTYPFSEPETRALRDFLTDARVVVFYHSAAGAVYADSCQRFLPSVRLADVLAEGTGYSLPEDGWTGYRITGDFGDYLAGEGVAAATVELSDHENSELERNLEGVRLLLARVDEIVGADALAAGAKLVWLEASACAWRYAPGSFVHPIALEVIGDTVYLLDSGKVLELDLGAGATGLACDLAEIGAAPPSSRLLLRAGDSVGGVQVIEPLDLAASAAQGLAQASLLVLDRAGDVYRFEPETGSWTIERYGRVSIDTGDHYYVGLSAFGAEDFLLETTREKVWRFAQGQKGSAWADLPLGRDVDLAATADSVYVLTRALNKPMGSLVRYPRSEGGVSGKAAASPAFRPSVTIVQPRQVVATDPTAYLLDQAGRRLLALDPLSGALLTEYQFSDRRAVSAIWAAPDPRPADQPARPDLILAGCDVLYFYPGDGAASRERGAVAYQSEVSPAPHDPAWLESLRGLAMPIEGATITRRDYQMPGSPRHYRLGVHQGIDFYGGTSGVSIVRGTPVRAVAAGKVIRAMLDYQPLTAAQASAWATEVANRGYTPDDVLDGYRGRQVWIEHENGLVSRYAHLSAIAPGVSEGATVEAGQVIGMVGNSGTPESVHNPSGEMHLHLELWAGAHYVGQFLRPIEAREWIERILR